MNERVQYGLTSDPPGDIGDLELLEAHGIDGRYVQVRLEEPTEFLQRPQQRAPNVAAEVVPGGVLPAREDHFVAGSVARQRRSGAKKEDGGKRDTTVRREPQCTQKVTIRQFREIPPLGVRSNDLAQQQELFRVQIRQFDARQYFGGRVASAGRYDKLGQG